MPVRRDGTQLMRTMATGLMPPTSPLSAREKTKEIGPPAALAAFRHHPGLCFRMSVCSSLCRHQAQRPPPRAWHCPSHHVVPRVSSMSSAECRAPGSEAMKMALVLYWTWSWERAFANLTTRVATFTTLMR